MLDQIAETREQVEQLTSGFTREMEPDSDLLAELEGLTAASQGEVV